MRSLDPRLLRRAPPVRHLLAADVAAGLGIALLVLLQAVLLARIVARAFHGAPLSSVAADLVLLALVFAGRGALAWTVEVAGRRAAQSVLSDLRLALVERRLSAQPTAADGTSEGEVVAAAVQGVDGLEAYFARYLPQVVLACLVPVSVLVLVATIDVESALLMLATLPLVPIFMWLVGRYTEERTRERWLALRLLSTHFLDVVRGLPTLRAFNRGRAQAATIADVGERYRRATMGTLRVGFLSGSVLELAATLGVALVAVTVGVRLVGGGLGLQAGLTVLVLAPELYLPLRQLGAQYHASADGLAVADRILELLDAPATAAPGGALAAPSPAEATVRLEDVTFAYPARPGLVLTASASSYGPERRPRSSARAAPGRAPSSTSCSASPLRPGDASRSAGSTSRTAAWTRGGSTSPGSPSGRRSCAAPSPTTSGSAIRRRRKPRCETRPCWRAPTRSSGRSPAGYATIVGDGGRALSAGERRRTRARARLPAAGPARDPGRADGGSRSDERRCRRRGDRAVPGGHDGAADRAPA